MNSIKFVILAFFVLFLSTFASAGTWTIESIDNQDYTGWNSIPSSISVAIDPNGIPHMAYYEPKIGSTTEGSLKYAVRNGNGSGNCPLSAEWNCEVVEAFTQNNEIIGFYSSIGFDNFGNPVIGYTTSSGTGLFNIDNRVRYTKKISGSWVTEDVEVWLNTSSSFWPISAIHGQSSNPIPFLSHSTGNVAKKIGTGGSGCFNNPGTEWECETLAVTGGGIGIATALNSSDAQRVITLEQLIGGPNGSQADYFEYNPSTSTWAKTILINDGVFQTFESRSPSISFNSSDKARIAYIGARTSTNRKAIQYAEEVTPGSGSGCAAGITNWDCEEAYVIASGHTVVSSLQVGNDESYLAYIDNGSGAGLRLLKRDSSGSWVDEGGGIIDTAARPAANVSLALGAYNSTNNCSGACAPRIAYSTGTTIKFASYNPDGTPPTYNWILPTANSFYTTRNPNNTFSVRVGITETESFVPDGVDCDFKINGSKTGFTGNVSYSTFTQECTGNITLNSGAFADGVHQLTVQVANIYGETQLSPQQPINVDNTPPAYSWISPGNGSSFKSGDSIFVNNAITETGTGVIIGDSCLPKIDGKLPGSPGSGFTEPTPVIMTDISGSIFCQGTLLVGGTLSAGNHSLTLDGKDNLGNTATSAPISFCFDDGSGNCGGGGGTNPSNILAISTVTITPVTPTESPSLFKTDITVLNLLIGDPNYQGLNSSPRLDIVMNIINLSTGATVLTRQTNDVWDELTAVGSYTFTYNGLTLPAGAYQAVATIGAADFDYSGSSVTETTLLDNTLDKEFNVQKAGGSGGCGGGGGSGGAGSGSGGGGCNTPPSDFVTISQTTLTPAQPVNGQPITLTGSIQNLLLGNVNYGGSGTGHVGVTVFDGITLVGRIPPVLKQFNSLITNVTFDLTTIPNLPLNKTLTVYFYVSRTDPGNAIPNPDGLLFTWNGTPAVELSTANNVKATSFTISPGGKIETDALAIKSLTVNGLYEGDAFSFDVIVENFDSSAQQVTMDYALTDRFNQSKESVTGTVYTLQPGSDPTTNTIHVDFLNGPLLLNAENPFLLNVHFAPGTINGTLETTLENNDAVNSFPILSNSTSTIPEIEGSQILMILSIVLGIIIYSSKRNN